MHGLLKPFALLTREQRREHKMAMHSKEIQNWKTGRPEGQRMVFIFCLFLFRLFICPHALPMPSPSCLTPATMSYSVRVPALKTLFLP
jgi:hypothetical protein